jgi:pimeloyl-ACP methyl ester carboxylesterase
MIRWNVRGLIALICLVGVCAHSSATFAGGTDAEATAPLAELVHSFFRIDDARQRSSFIPAIKEAANGSVEAVAGAVMKLQLWTELPSAHGAFLFAPTTGTPFDVSYNLPMDYDPTTGYPVLLCMPDRGKSPTLTFALAHDVLGEALKGFILASPSRRVGGTFHQSAEAAADLRRLMRDLRRLIHIDTDRAFLFGAGAGGDAAWITAITHADLFAGAIMLSSYLQVPYPEQVYPLLLEDLRRLPVLTVWSTPAIRQTTTREALVAAHNRAAVALAARTGLPIAGLEEPTSPLDELKPPSDQAAALLSRRRATPASSISRWFRYPGQGNSGWLRQTKFAGDAWLTRQLSILTTPLIDRDRFISDVIREKLAYLGGRIEGQAITIETKSCARIDVLLPYGLMDLEHPITVRCNGKRRYSRRVRPSIKTLLQTAYEDWEFQHLTVARLSFSIKADGMPP